MASLRSLARLQGSVAMCARVGLALALLASLEGASGHPSSMCMLLLGDSITQHYATHQGWRYLLWKQLLGERIHPQFVGSMDSNFPTSPEYPDYLGHAFSNVHEGHWGWTTEQVLSGLPSWSQHYSCQPSCILVHLGTNDVTQGADVELLHARLARLVGQIRGFSPRARVLLAVPIPTCSEATVSVAPGAVELVAAQYANVTLVRQDEGFDRAWSGHSGQDTWDGCHPNEQGHIKMANKWFRAVIRSCAGGANETNGEPVTQSEHVEESTEPVYTAPLVVVILVPILLFGLVLISMCYMWKRAVYGRVPVEQIEDSHAQMELEPESP